MIKIKFPSPSELSNKDWFEQMELSLFHAKKAYDKFIKDIPENKLEDVSLRFVFPEMEKNEIYQKLVENIELVIDY